MTDNGNGDGGAAPSEQRKRTYTHSRWFHDGNFVFLVFAGFRALGDFVNTLCFTTFLSRAVKNAQPTFIVRNDRPYKLPMVDMCPAAAQRLVLGGADGAPMPLDWFDFAGQNPHRGPDQIYQTFIPYSELIITPFQVSKAMNTRALPYVKALHMPDAMAAENTRKLADRGLDVNRWFVCVFVREENYLHRANIRDGRSADPQKYFDLASHIIDDLGGQVVRIGHSAGSAWRKEGLVDLKDEENDFFIQACAMQFARFFIGGNSGPPSVANAFGTPVAFVDDTAPHTGLSPWSCLLTKEITPREEDLSDLKERFLQNRWIPLPENSSFVDNSLEDLKAVTHHMMEMTADCEGWRDRWAPESGIPESETISFPLAPRPQPDNYFRTPWWEKL